jgi:uncharacterized protein YggE
VSSLKIFKTAALLAVVAFSVSGFASAQGLPTFTRSISVTGIGEAAGTPDKAQISAGVQTQASSVPDSSRMNQAIVERIMQALDKQGIDRKDVQTASYSIWPEQRYDQGGSGEMTIAGYNVSNVVNVTIKDINRVGEVLAAVTNAGANSIQGVNFGVKDTAALEQRARATAMADARARAEALAKLAGVELGEVQTISLTSGGGFPMPMFAGGRMEMASVAVAPGISEGQYSVSVQVNVTYAIR